MKTILSVVCFLAAITIIDGKTLIAAALFYVSNQIWDEAHKDHK